ncbi:MAG: amidohydrolase [Chitinophagaceae bacterium]|nr:amidohydrolase [Chitinophagaceae bacterium]
MKYLMLIIFSELALSGIAQISALKSRVPKAADDISEKVIAWRRDFHEHPELSNRETRTAEVIATYLRSLGLEVKTGIAKTGVVAILRGGKPGPVVALRADMDALPVKERVKLPFASKEKTIYNGQEVGVMHACGHDSHMAILMGAAEILTSMKKDLPGTVKFIFQPAEEGPSAGEEGGAKLMVKEGVLSDPKVEVIFGIHINSQLEVGTIAYRPGGTMASVNDLHIIVKGKSAHGAYPWLAIDPVVVSAQIINNLQTIVSRNLNVTQNAGVVTIASIHGGNRSNIIPEQVEMLGTIRALSSDDEKMLIARVKEVAIKTAESAGAVAEVKIPYSTSNPVTYNDPALMDKMLPTLVRTAGKDHVHLRQAVTGSEDFSFFQKEIPGLFLFVGAMPKGQNPATAPSHHTPDFYLDESGFNTGVRLMCNLVLDYMDSAK